MKLSFKDTRLLLIFSGVIFLLVAVMFFIEFETDRPWKGIQRDFVELDEALDIASQISRWVDGIEAGTPLILREGLRVVTELKAQCPAHTIVADLKIMDAGKEETELALEAGADVVTVLACASDGTIAGAVEAARCYDRKIMIDLMGVDDIRSRAGQLELLGADYLCVHTGFDEQKRGKGSLEDLSLVAEATRLPLAVAGGMKLETIPQVLPYRPEVVIVGGALVSAQEKLE